MIDAPSFHGRFKAFAYLGSLIKFYLDHCRELALINHGSESSLGQFALGGSRNDRGFSGFCLALRECTSATLHGILDSLTCCCGRHRLLIPVCLLLFRATLFLVTGDVILTVIAHSHSDNLTRRSYNLGDLHWLELFLNVTVKRTLSDNQGGQLLVKLVHIEVNLEQARVGHANDVAQLLQAIVCQVCASFNRQVCQFGVLLELLSQFVKAIIGEHVVIEYNGAQVGIRSQVAGQHTQAVIMDPRVSEVD